MLNLNTKPRIGRLFSTIAALLILGSAITKLVRLPVVIGNLTHAGLPEASILPIAILELSCLALYLIPRTSVLGTLLLTGYLGGAIVVHIISRETIVPPLAVGILVVTGAYLRFSELRDLLPFRRRIDDHHASVDSGLLRSNAGMPPVLG